MDTCSRSCHRRITLTSATLITPASPAQGTSGNGDYTWVKFRCKYLLQAGQYSVQFNTDGSFCTLKGNYIVMATGWLGPRRRDIDSESLAPRANEVTDGSAVHPLES